jgi:hypothetical protein
VIPGHPHTMQIFQVDHERRMAFTYFDAPISWIFSTYICEIDKSSIPRPNRQRNNAGLADHPIRPFLIFSDFGLGWCLCSLSSSLCLRERGFCFAKVDHPFFQFGCIDIRPCKEASILNGRALTAFAL